MTPVNTEPGSLCEWVINFGQRGVACGYSNQNYNRRAIFYSSCSLLISSYPWEHVSFWRRKQTTFRNVKRDSGCCEITTLLSFHNLFVYLHVHRMKFQWNYSLECIITFSLGKQNVHTKKVFLGCRLLNTLWLVPRGTVNFVSRESQSFPRRSWGKHWDSRETKFTVFRGTSR